MSVRVNQAGRLYRTSAEAAARIVAKGEGSLVEPPKSRTVRRKKVKGAAKEEEKEDGKDN